MKIFEARDLELAKEYALNGGQALHLHKFIGNRAFAPKCFVRAVDRGEFIAHLFDQNEARLVATVRRLGVQVIKLERRGTDRQHVDLCGQPLQRAIEEAKANLDGPDQPTESPGS